jgi:Arc/MetJ-type ribon-helix-helix transcriptional regulator
MQRQREKLSVTVPQELIDWLDEMVQKRTFANRSHGTELCIRAMREAEEKRAKK